MAKPKVFIFDWKEKSYYKEIGDIVDIERGTKEPNPSLFECVIFHTYIPYRAIDYFKKAKSFDTYLIIHTLSENHLIEIKNAQRIAKLEYDKLFYFTSYKKLFEKVREIFG